MSEKSEESTHSGRQALRSSSSSADIDPTGWMFLTPSVPSSTLDANHSTPSFSYKGDLTKVGSTTPLSPFKARIKELANRAPAKSCQLELFSVDMLRLTETHGEGSGSGTGLGLDDLVTTELDPLDEGLVLLTLDILSNAGLRE